MRIFSRTIAKPWPRSSTTFAPAPAPEPPPRALPAGEWGQPPAKVAPPAPVPAPPPVSPGVALQR